MSRIDPYIVKITSAKGTGSGFILFPPSDPDQIYIVTARHLFLEDDETIPEKKEISINFWGNSPTYQLKATDLFYLGENNESEDCGLIILPSNTITKDIDLRKSPIPFAVPENQTIHCQASGYPKLTDNAATRTLYACQLLTDKDYPNELQVEVNDPLTQQHNADDLVEGYSGSPIFVNIEEQIYIAGVFLGYEPASERISAINIAFLNTLLERNNSAVLAMEPKELNPVILMDIKKTANNTERILNRIKSNIGSVHISRPELEKQLKEIIFKKSLTVVYGKPGIGKSAIAKKVLSALTGYAVIALQGEQLDKLSIQEVFGSPAIGISTEISELLSSPGLTPQKIIFIDSIEKLLETNNAETIIDFFNLIKSRNDLRLVLTCRSYAIEQLKIRFLQQFTDFYDFEVPVLSDEELTVVGGTYTFLTDLLSNSSLKRILQIPFNIDKATLIHCGALNATINSELDFKQVMWDYVIEGKENQPDATRRKLRGKIFSEIAYKRAQAMVPYVELPTVHQLIIHDLQKDQLIDTDMVLNNRYSPSHDIYEDWALTRKIEADFQNYLMDQLILDFFQAIGSAPAIRRAFRIWISEKLQIIDFNIKDLILNCLGKPTVAAHWKDEILIAIMQSPYSKEFLENNKGFLFENDRYLFKRCALLLRVACQSPDFSYLSYFPAEDKNYIYMSGYLKPYGEGWPNMITFMLANLDELLSDFKLLMQIVFQWEKSVDRQSLPPEAKSAALLLHKYFQYRLTHQDDAFIALDRDETATGIQLLFKLASLIPDEIRDMLVESIADETNDDHRRGGFWGSFKHTVLSWEHSYPVCELYPDLVMAIAEKEWFYYAPTEEELRTRYSHSPLGYFPRTIDKDEKFGLTADRDYRYSPASAYQTPVWHLLRYAPLSALDFIIRLFNHSAEAFFQSDFLKTSDFWPDDERNIFKLEINESTTTEVYGSQLLWAIYRGLYNITSPTLLQSVLMALEKWLLNLATMVVKDTKNQYPIYRENFEFAFNHLLSESKSVSILAVLVSVATAQPELCKKLIQPLLKTRRFYKWDLIRCTREGSTRFMTFEDSKLIKIERQQSDEMPHHREEMEMLIRRLTFTSERPAIYALLDEFYAQNPEELNWKLALNRMDLRKAEVVEETESGYVLMPKIDEELKPMVADAEREEQAIMPIRVAGNWALQKWDGKALEDDSYQQWQVHQQHVLKANKANKQTQLFNQPGTIAAIGIRFYFEELSEKEKQWCMEQIFHIAEAEIKDSHHYYGVENDGSYSAFDPDHVFQILVTLVEKCTGDQLTWAKELLFASLLFIRNDLHRDKLLESIQTDLWRINPDFAMSCVAGLLEYAKIAEIRTRINNFHPGHRFEQQPAWKKSKLINKLLTLKNKIRRMVQGSVLMTKKREKADEDLKQQWAQQYNDRVSGIIDQVLGGTIELNYSNQSGVKFSPHYLIEILRIIPSDNRSPEIERYYIFVIDYLLSHITREDLNRMEEIHYSLQQKFATSFANYLLLQPAGHVLPLFQKLTNWLLVKGEKPIAYRFSDKRLELAKTVLKEMLWKVYHQDTLPVSFWVVWEYVFEALVQDVRFFNELLLLNPGYSVKTSWNGITGKKTFYKKVIYKLQDIDETIRLLAGPGFNELMPEAIEWYADLIRDKELKDNNTTYLSEKMMINVYYNKTLRTNIKGNLRLKQSFISILDILINHSSAAAFLIREDFISIK